MRDGVTLSADVYTPANRSGEAKQFPVILTRTPYLKLSEGMLGVAKYFAERGYVFVAMDVRGRGDSDGVFIPYFHEENDGYDAIEWCAAQPWSDGNVGTIGSSYPGVIQWLAALQQPPHLGTEERLSFCNGSDRGDQLVLGGFFKNVGAGSGA